MATKDKITVREHAILKAAMDRPGGVLLGDQRVLQSLLRRALARSDDGILVINEVGIWSVGNAPLDQTNQPAHMTDDRFAEYLRTRGAKEAR